MVYLNKNAPFLLLFFLVVIFIATFSFLNISKFHNFSETCFGWQYFYSYPKIAGGNNIFADRNYFLPEYPVMVYLFLPINFIIAFIYKIIPFPEVLLFLQGVILASGSFPIYLFARKRLHSDYLAVSLSISYLLNPITATGAILGYIPISLGALFLLYAFYYLEKDNFRRFIVFIVLANMVKIDIVTMTIILGIILYFSKNHKVSGRLIFKIGVIWLILVFTLGIVYLKLAKRPFPIGILHFDKYGDTLSQVIHYVLKNPFLAIKNIFNMRNMLLYIFYPFPNIFSFISPLFLIPVIPEVGFVLIRNQHSSGLFLILAFVFVATILGLEKFINRLNAIHLKYLFSNSKYVYHNLLATLILVFASLHYYYIKPSCDFSNELGPLPFAKNFNPKFYQTTKHSEVGYEFLKKLPPDKSCLTLQSLAAHLGRHQHIGIINRIALRENFEWDYIFVDLYKKDFYQITKKDYLLALRKFLLRDEYGVRDFKDGWLIIGKGQGRARNCEALDYISELIENEKGI